MSQPTGVSQLANTDEALRMLYALFFNDNAILTWTHLFIVAVALAIMYWLGRLDKFCRKCKDSAECYDLSWDVIAGTKTSTAQFLTAFPTSFALFILAILFEKMGASGIIVQLLTYFPTLIVACVQLVSLTKMGFLIKRHLEG